jgi:hypothetical protein
VQEIRGYYSSQKASEVLGSYAASRSFKTSTQVTRDPRLVMRLKLMTAAGGAKMQLTTESVVHVKLDASLSPDYYHHSGSTVRVRPPWKTQMLLACKASTNLRLLGPARQFPEKPVANKDFTDRRVGKSPWTSDHSSIVWFSVR